MTQVYVEQVIIGALVIVTVFVLATGALPVIPEKFNEIAAGLLFIGGAYVVGILYDRCANTLVERIERRHVLKFAMKKFNLHWPLRRDPFPAYSEKQVLDSKPLPYLQSRMRILRGLTTLVPAMTITVLVLRNPEERFLVGPAIAVIYLLFGLLSAFVEFPTTDHSYYLNRSPKLPLPLEPIVLGLVEMTVLALLVANCDPDAIVALELAIAGTILTLISAWAWLRVNVTIMQLIVKTAATPKVPEPQECSGTSPQNPARTQ